MSRKGNQPISLPKGVEVKVQNNEVTVKGPKGILSHKICDGIIVAIENDQCLVTVEKDRAGMTRWHGLYRSIIANMVIGTSSGFQRTLELIGVGYRAAVKGHMVDLQLGYSHPTSVEIPKGITVKVEKNTITLEGTDKQQVGQLAADIRAMRPPEPYQGKGIRYTNEYVRKKAGKAAAKK